MTHSRTARAGSYCFLVALLGAGAAPAQDCQAAPIGLTVLVVDVDQGSGAIIRSPSGRTVVFDAGPEGFGTSAMLPALRGLGVTDVFAAVASHYHTDHIGGMDEVLRGIPVTTAYDRGTGSVPTTSAYTSYVSAAGTRRRAITAGTQIDLLAGARLTTLTENGNLIGGGRVDISGSSQWENSASVSMKLTYGRFALFIGGDLTGGGSSTSDVESAMAPLCGDVDVHVCNHHGSFTSNNATLLSVMRPECCIASCGDANPYGHPSVDVVNRVNTATNSRAFWCTTAGVDYTGYTRGGTIRIDTDGERYRVTLQTGQYADFFVDEIAGTAPQAGELVISELMRQPSRVADNLGEYLELANVSGRALSLLGLRVTSLSGAFTVSAPYRLLPGERLLFTRHGNPATNGGIAGGHCLPFNVFSLGNASDTISVFNAGNVLVERLTYGAGFPGGAGIAAERADLLGPATAASFAAATTTYGVGDRGTPGARNATDRTAWPTRIHVETLAGASPSLLLHLSSLSAPAAIDLAALALGSVPGFDLGTVHVPMNPDTLFLLSITLPGAVSVLPASGYRCWSLPIPAESGLNGVPAFADHLVLDLLAANPVRSLSPAFSFQFP